MASKDITGLLPLLHSAKADELVFLDNENITWLPRLRNLNWNSMFYTIWSAVNTAPTEWKRCRRIARIRSWLIPQLQIYNWSFYRLPEADTLDKCIAVLDRIASYLSSLNQGARQAPYGFTVRGNLVYACLFTEAGSNNFVYVIFWTTEPMIALHCSSLIVQGLVCAGLPNACGGNTVLLADSSRIGFSAAFYQARSTLRQESPHRAGLLSTTAHQQARALLSTPSQTEQLSTSSGASASTLQDVAAALPFLSCLRCRAEFPSEETFMQHWQKAHPQEGKMLYMCTLCPYWTYFSTDLQLHSQAHDTVSSSSMDTPSPELGEEEAIGE